jgi:hypothetical protein
MKKIAVVLFMIFLFVAMWIFLPQHAQAGLEWSTLKKVNLKTKPLDVSLSEDGQVLFILTPGEILVYSVPKGEITNKIPVGKNFDRLSYSTKANALTVTSSTKKAIEIILLENVHEIDTAGLPYKGPENAPVTIAVFTDYQ